jgi:hypothetical protein
MAWSIPSPEPALILISSPAPQGALFFCFSSIAPDFSLYVPLRQCGAWMRQKNKFIPRYVHDVINKINKTSKPLVFYEN